MNYPLYPKYIFRNGDQRDDHIVVHSEEEQLSAADRGYFAWGEATNASDPVDPLAEMTKAQLVEHAATLGIELDPKAKKEDMLARLQGATATA